MAKKTYWGGRDLLPGTAESLITLKLPLIIRLGLKSKVRIEMSFVWFTEPPRWTLDRLLVMQVFKHQ